MTACAWDSVSTSAIAPEARLAYWNQFVADAFDDIVVDAGDGFTGDARFRRIGAIEFARVDSSAAQVRRISPLINSAKGPLFKIHLQENGCGINRQAGREAVLQPGGFTLCDASQPYSLEFNDLNRMMVLRFPAERLVTRLPDPDRYIGLAVDTNAGASRMLTTFLRSVWETEDTGDCEDALSDIVLDMVAMALRPHGAPLNDGAEGGDRTKAIRAYIDGHICDPDLRASGVARAVGVSSRLMQLMFARSGTTVTEYIVRRRLDLAAQRLARAAQAGLSVNITELAYDVGFSDLTYFSKSFKRRFGVSPRGYGAAGRA